MTGPADRESPDSPNAPVAGELSTPPGRSRRNTSSAHERGTDVTSRLPARWLLILTVLATLAAMRVAQAILIPIVAGLLLSLLFKPLVRRTVRLGVPRFITAAAVVFGLFLVIAGGISAGSGAVAAWIDTMPRDLRALQHQTVAWLESYVEGEDAPADAAEHVVTADEGPQDAENSQDVPRFDPLGALASLATDAAGTIVSGTGVFVMGLVITLILTYFLLASDDRFLRATLRTLARVPDEHRAFDAVSELEEDISQYLAMLTLINVTLAALMSVLFTLVGLPQAVVWGVLAGLINYVPYLGPVVYVVLLTPVSLLSFDSLAWGLVPPAMFLTVNLLEAYVISPTIYGHRFRMNPAVVFLAIVGWGWLWGVAGALMAVPLLVSFKIVCDHVPALRPAGALIAGEELAHTPPSDTRGDE